MPVRRTSIVVSVIVGFVVALVVRLDPVQSISAVAAAGDGESCPLATLISQALFTALEFTGVGVVAWFCFRMFMRGKNDHRSRR